VRYASANHICWQNISIVIFANDHIFLPHFFHCCLGNEIIPAAKIGKIINKKQEKNAFFFTYQPKSVVRICHGVIL